ncbi:MAG: M56 family metallopeptidase [Acidobacteriia bacterium]|nr:M56 family metallopeptidase [Terriglobia bacterium]
MTPALDLNTIARFSVQHMADCLVGGMFLFLLAALWLRVAGRQNSGTRFAVWVSVLAGIAVLALSGGAWISGTTTVPSAAMAARSAITIPGSWALYVFLAWVAVAAVGLARVGTGLWHLCALRKACTELDRERLDPLLRETITRNAGARTATLCVSDRVQAPTAIGLMKPAVILPSGLMQELSTAELQPVLLHELAHLRRWDDWTNLLQKIVKALLFFHPVVWWIEARISLEREMACDDAVLAETADPRAYAQCLVYLAEKSLLKRSMALAQAAVSRIGQTSRRVAQILDGDRPRTTRVWKPAVSLVAILAFASLVLLGHAPKLVAFRDDAARRVTAVAPSVQSETKESVPGGVHDAPKPAPRKVHASPQVLAAKSQAKPRVPQPNDSAIEAKSGKPAIAPAVVPVKSAEDRPAQTATFLVFVEQRSYGANGILEWQFAVWHITVQPQTDNPTTKGITRKSI